MFKWKRKQSLPAQRFIMFVPLAKGHVMPKQLRLRQMESKQTKFYRTVRVGVSPNDSEEEILNKELEVLVQDNLNFELLDIKFLYKSREGTVYYLVIYSFDGVLS